MFVFSRKKLELKPAFSNILKCLSVCDIVFLVSTPPYCMPYSILHTPLKACVIWLYGVPEIIPTVYRDIEPHATPWVLPVTQCALTGKDTFLQLLNFAWKVHFTLSYFTYCTNHHLRLNQKTSAHIAYDVSQQCYCFEKILT